MLKFVNNIGSAVVFTNKYLNENSFLKSLLRYLLTLWLSPFANSLLSNDAYENRGQSYEASTIINYYFRVIIRTIFYLVTTPLNRAFIRMGRGSGHRVCLLLRQSKF